MEKQFDTAVAAYDLFTMIENIVPNLLLEDKIRLAGEIVHFAKRFTGLKATHNLLIEIGSNLKQQAH